MDKKNGNDHFEGEESGDYSHRNSGDQQNSTHELKQHENHGKKRGERDAHVAEHTRYAVMTELEDLLISVRKKYHADNNAKDSKSPGLQLSAKHGRSFVRAVRLDRTRSMYLHEDARINWNAVIFVR